jgi:hypothetical protein
MVSSWFGTRRRGLVSTQCYSDVGGPAEWRSTFRLRLYKLADSLSTPADAQDNFSAVIAGLLQHDDAHLERELAAGERHLADRRLLGLGTWPLEPVGAPR